MSRQDHREIAIDQCQNGFERIAHRVGDGDKVAVSPQISPAISTGVRAKVTNIRSMNPRVSSSSLAILSPCIRLAMPVNAE